METCDKCKKKYQTVWTCPDYLWETITGKKENGLLCMKCFDDIARNMNITLYWKCDIRWK